jgi:hypothetical protein
MRWLVGVVALTVILVGCNSPASSTEPASSDSPAPSVAAATSCHPLDLRSPNGEEVDLTGTWQGPARLLSVRQFGRCVWWEELSAFVDDEPPGYHYRRLFQGELLSDFTIVGRFGDVYTRTSPSIYVHPPPREGDAIYQISFEGEGASEVVVLAGPFLDAVSQGESITDWTRISDSTELP